MSDSCARALSTLAVLAFALIRPQFIAAEEHSWGSILIAGGAGVRGEGRAAECCGPFRSSLERSTSVWLGGGLSYELGRRVALDGEVTWAREPRYQAYVQGFFGDAPIRGYASDNLVSSTVTAGLVRWHLVRGRVATVDAVGGLAWVHEQRVSDLRSIVFRPQPVPAPEYTFRVADTRHTAAFPLGLDVSVGSGRVALVGQCRAYLHWHGDPDRSDLDLGRQVVRLGAGLRLRV